MSTIAAESRASTSPARWLRIDALMSGGSGTLAVAGGWALDSVLGVSAAFLVVLGLLLVAYAAVLVALARAGAPPAGVWAVVLGNAAWVAASVAVVATDALTLTAAGTAVALAQAAAVAVVAAVQTASVRR